MDSHRVTKNHCGRAPQTGKPAVYCAREIVNCGIRIVTFASGGDIGDDLGCIAMINPISRPLLHPMTRGTPSSEIRRCTLVQYTSFFC